MATTKTPEHEAKNAGQAAGETAEATGKAVKKMADRTAPATAHHAERASETASDAVERTTNVAADIAGRIVRRTADSLDHNTIISIPREGIAVATKTQKQAFESIERAGASILRGMSEMQAEIAGFVSERIRQDLEAQQELLSCRTLEEVGEVQSRFLRTTIDQYSAEASRLMQLGTDVFTRSIDPSRADVQAADH